MEAYRIKKIVEANGALRLDALPFPEGELVEVIIIADDGKMRHSDHSPLRGKVIEYANPTEPVAEDDWELLK